MFPEKPSVPLANVAIGDFTFSQKELEPRVLPWKQHIRYHLLSFVMYISGAKFEEHCSDISGDILDSVSYCLSILYDVVNLLICIIQKREYLKNEKRYSIKENAILLHFEKPFK